MPLPPRSVDITLLLEGSYPYVRGGVSSWVHQLIEGLPEFNFSLVHLGAEKLPDEQVRYQLPPNVLELHPHYLAGEVTSDKPRARDGNADYFAASDQLHDWFRHPEGAPKNDWLDRVVLQKDLAKAGDADDFFYSKAAWAQIRESYARYCPQAPFQSYFWSVRNMHAPLLKLAAIARSVGPTRVFHTVTTGYAGLLGAMLQQLTGRPLILTEHGIYTKERKIELQSLFLREVPVGASHAADSGMEHHHQAWIRMFEGIGRLVYHAANPIVTLYEQNRQRQIRDGADARRTQLIPNGVDVARFAPLRARRPEQTPMVLGLIGRIVPIKDIKTFIRAVGVLADKLPQVQGWLIGPEEEDPVYVEECKALVKSLQLEDTIRFMGFQKVEDMLPQLGLQVLTSISEAFPLVILEGLASGVPALATDVGACRDLIEGNEPADRALGPAGEVVPIVDYDALARAAHSLLTDTGRWRAAQQAGIARVERYYQQSIVIDGYREIYRRTGVH
ncbi:MAG: GT4 family glycosyltransferase PelF [Burkholderiaceae bacterium]|nr:GT4 family glycosyltransferase PelF [Burkholderiaceae bacterium]MDZ4145035.1 GT4 family glycosyltransferase PelF [Burkholderiales bacterium]